MECLGFQRLLEISLAAGQICDPIRASLMRKCSLTQRENKEGRGEHVNGKREVEREKEGGGKLQEPRKLIYQSLSPPITEEDKKLHPTTHMTAQTLIMNEQEAAPLPLFKRMRLWGWFLSSSRGQGRPSIASFPLAPRLRKHLATWD